MSKYTWVSICALWVAMGIVAPAASAQSLQSGNAPGAATQVGPADGKRSPVRDGEADPVSLIDLHEGRFARTPIAIRIGRLELRQKDNRDSPYIPYSGHADVARVLGLTSKPAFSLIFNLHWRQP
jgi:hypothetical protein